MRSAGLVSRRRLARGDNPEVLEVDLNPVIAGPAGAVVVDALLVIGTQTGPTDLDPDRARRVQVNYTP